MFSIGIGEQLAEVLDSASCHRAMLSNLKSQGVLGAGSFGKVLRVLDVKTAEVYALKLQRRDQTAKFAVCEARALHRSSHAYIVRLVHIFQTSTFYAILMELCERNLNACIVEPSEEGGRAQGLPKANTQRYAACVAIALEHLHGLCIVFRDLKPENILLVSKDKGDFAKLADFGLARTVDLDVGAGESPSGDAKLGLSYGGSAVCGTSHFMAPEVLNQQVFNECIDMFPGASGQLRCVMSRDWYAFGCCLLLMLLGEDGGKMVRTGGRRVLVPPVGQELRRVLRCSWPLGRADEQALQLVDELTAPVFERAGYEELSTSPFLQEPIAEMQVAAMQRQGADDDGAPSSAAAASNLSSRLKIVASWPTFDGREHQPSMSRADTIP
mmetsp:Transcript_101778/g.283394  ORF Transcript_101778/g.283394 Transcript_101778/m.283394 type:complete len:384 (-) Transcript_101778:75-1226(-)